MASAATLLLGSGLTAQAASTPDSVRVVLQGKGPFQIQMLNQYKTRPLPAGDLIIVNKLTGATLQNLTVLKGKGYLADPAKPHNTPEGIEGYANLPAGTYSFQFAPRGDAPMNAYFEIANVGVFGCGKVAKAISIGCMNEYKVTKTDCYQGDTTLAFGKKGVTSSANDLVTVNYSCGHDSAGSPRTLRINNIGTKALTYSFRTEAGITTPTGKVTVTEVKTKKAITVDLAKINNKTPAFTDLNPGFYDFEMDPTAVASLELFDHETNSPMEFILDGKEMEFRSENPANKTQNGQFFKTHPPVFSRFGNTPAFNNNMMTVTSSK